MPTHFCREKIDPKAKLGGTKDSALLGDSFVHEPKKYQVKGSGSGQSYTLGDIVKIKLTRADMKERVLDFELVS